MLNGNRLDVNFISKQGKEKKMIKLSKISRALLAFAMAMTTVSSYATATVHAADFSGFVYNK